MAVFLAFLFNIVTLGLLTLLAGYTLAYSEEERGRMANELPTKQTVQAGAPQSKLRRAIGNRSFIASSMVMLTASAGVGTVTNFLTLYVKQTAIGHAGIYFAIQSGIIVIARFALRNKLPSDGKWHAKRLFLLLFSMAVGLAMTALAPTFGEAISLYIGATAIGHGMASLYPILGDNLSIALGQETRKIWKGLLISISDLGVVIGSIGMGVLPMGRAILMFSVYARVCCS